MAGSGSEILFVKISRWAVTATAPRAIHDEGGIFHPAPWSKLALLPGFPLLKSPLALLPACGIQGALEGLSSLEALGQGEAALARFAQELESGGVVSLSRFFQALPVVPALVAQKELLQLLKNFPPANLVGASKEKVDGLLALGKAEPDREGMEILASVRESLRQEAKEVRLSSVQGPDRQELKKRLFIPPFLIELEKLFEGFAPQGLILFFEKEAAKLDLGNVELPEVHKQSDPAKRREAAKLRVSAVQNEAPGL